VKHTKIVLALLMFVAAAALVAPAQTQVFVSGQTNGAFGGPIDLTIPYVPAITVDGPATITVTYLDGTVTDAGLVDTGPNGVDWDCDKSWQTPLQEVHGMAGGKCSNLDALIGIFVPQSRTTHNGFNPLDGTKGLTRIGIMPNQVFFIGEGKTFDVTEAGTLYLGINDCYVSDNGGGFNVEVSASE